MHRANTLRKLFSSVHTFNVSCTRAVSSSIIKPPGYHEKVDIRSANRSFNTGKKDENKAEKVGKKHSDRKFNQTFTKTFNLMIFIRTIANRRAEEA